MDPYCVHVIPQKASAIRAAHRQMSVRLALARETLAAYDKHSPADELSRERGQRGVISRADQLESVGLATESTLQARRASE